jgi:hypothetical protein
MDYTGIPFGEVLASLRDAFVIITAGTLIWKARGWYQAGIDLKNRCVRHMDTMEVGMEQLLGNHMQHIQTDLRNLVKREPDEIERNNG